MRAIVLAVVLLAGGVSVASAAPATELMAIAQPAPALPMGLLPLSAATLEAVVEPRGDHDIDMLTRAERAGRHDRFWRTIDISALVVSTAALACDWGQTYATASNGWSGGRWEHNPIMGSQPSSGAVTVYFATATILNAALWLALPRGYRSLVPVGVLAIQADSIQHNLNTAHNICGL